MKFDVENIGAVKKKIIVEIPVETVASEIEAAYGKLKNQVKMDGFRKGKVPRTVLERYYKGHVEYDVTTKLINDSFNKILSEKNIFPVSEPEIDAQPFAAGSTFAYTATVEIRPDLDVKGYEGLTIDLNDNISVTDSMVDDRVEALRRRNLTLKDVSRPLKDGDTAIIDFEGFMNGAPFQGGKGEGVPLKMGSGRFIPGFEEQLTGMTEGDYREINVKFPVDYNHKEFAGKDATFKVKLKGVKEEILPEADDEFAKDLGYVTLDEIKAHIKSEIEKEKASEIKGKMKERILDALIEANPFEAPPSMVKKQRDYLVENIKRRMGKAGLDLDKELEKGEAMDNLEKTAIKQVKGALILTAVAKKEGVKASDKEIDERLDSIAAENHVDVAAVRSYYEKNGLLDSLRREIMEDKVFDAIISKAVVAEI